MNIFLKLLSFVLLLVASGMLFSAVELFLKAIQMSGPDNMGYFLTLMFFVPGICLLIAAIGQYRASRKTQSSDD